MSQRKKARLDINPNFCTQLNSAEAVLPVTEYNTNYARRGHALILHHYEFSTSLCHLNPREGSEVDLERLKEILGSLEFEVQVYEDQTVAGIKMIIQNLAKTNHSDCDCLLVVVLTHGLANSMLYAKNATYSLQELWNPFMAEQCPSLAGKPKLFFIQACRGKKMDCGHRLFNKTDMNIQGNECDGYTKPSSPDFLIVYSSVEGYGSFRNTEKGTWFIQSLCDELETLIPDIDILTIMTRTMNRVALDYQARHYDNQGIHFKKQVPHIHSTLTKDVYFRPKNMTRCEDNMKLEENQENTTSTKDEEKQQAEQKENKNCEQELQQKSEKNKTLNQSPTQIDRNH